MDSSRNLYDNLSRIQAFKLWIGKKAQDRNIAAIASLLKVVIKFRYEK